MSGLEPRVDPGAAEWALRELLPEFIESLPAGYELRGGGRLVRLDPSLPEYVSIPTEGGEPIMSPAELAPEAAPFPTAL